MTLSDHLLPYQKDFIRAQKRFKLWVSGRQLGKSHTLGFEAVKAAISQQNALVLAISTGSRAASELLKKCVQYAEAVKILSDGSTDYQSSSDCVRFSNGGRILSLPSGNPAALRGYSSALTIIDECAFIERPDDVFAAISPTLTRNSEAKLILTSTPAGKNSLFYDYYQNALDDDDWYVQTTTIHDAISAGLKVDLEKLHKLCPDPDIFAQEYECVFSNEYGAFVDVEKLDFYDDSPNSSEYYLGMDIGRTNDRSAIVILKNCNGILYLDNIVVLNKMEYSQQLKIVKELHSRYKFASGYIDQTGIGSAFAEQVTKEVCSKLRGLQITGSNKPAMHEKLRSLVFDHKMRFKTEFKKQIEEDFNNMKRIVTESGNVKFEAGRNGNGHSDITSALVLAVKASDDMPASISLPTSKLPNSSFGRYMSLMR